MPDLFHQPKLKSGRQRTVTAKAWISRARTGGVFQSKVSLGDGVVHVLSTKTRRRDKALAFNRCHLLHRLKENPKSQIINHKHESEISCASHDPLRLEFRA